MAFKGPLKGKAVYLKCTTECRNCGFKRSLTPDFPDWGCTCDPYAYLYIDKGRDQNPLRTLEDFERGDTKARWPVKI